MTTRKFILGLITSTIVCGAFATQSGGASTYNFRVLLDEKPIGYHQFEFSQTDAGRQVSSEAQFDVKLLFITAFKYRHTSSERWNDNCLTEIEANTNSNGKRQNVSGERVNDVLRVDSSSGLRDVDGCVRTFAYWNPSILEASQLLNSQTGDYVDIEVTPLGADSLTLGGRDFDVRKFKIRSAPGYPGEPVDITLWYEATNMQWLALESLAKGDRTLRYELTNPVTPARPPLSATHANARR